MPDVKQAHLQTARIPYADQSLQKSLLCPPGKKNKKSPLSLKNKLCRHTTRQTGKE